MGTTILAMGRYAPETSVNFESGRRLRCLPNSQTQLDMGVKAARQALDNAGMTIGDIDLIISASAVIIQPIPCNAALYHEALQATPGTAALDICTTCTSFITALDMADLMLKAGKYRNILIISADIASIALNPEEKESYSLFSDGAAAAIVSMGEGQVVDAAQYTYSQGAHDTEIKAGGTLSPGFCFPPDRINDYRFTMKGLRAIKLVLNHMPKLLDAFLEKNQISLDDVRMIVPHQASPALDLIMKKLGVPKTQYVNIFPDYGNMVSASVPYALSHAIDQGLIKRGDKVLLLGSAAGLTLNILLLEL